MHDPEDIVDVSGLHLPKPGRSDREANGPRSKWKMVWFQCCHVYGRIYRNASGTRYDGQCPRCGGRVRALIGPQGTSQRIFRAQ